VKCEFPLPIIRIEWAALAHRREQYTVRDDRGRKLSEHCGHCVGVRPPSRCLRAQSFEQVVARLLGIRAPQAQKRVVFATEKWAAMQAGVQ
jgi:hypothetical protein